MPLYKKKTKMNNKVITNDIKTLNHLRKGESAIIVGLTDKFNKSCENEKRLLELGLVAGEKVKVIAESFPKNDPVVLKIGNSCFAFRRYELSNIEVLSD